MTNINFKSVVIIGLGLIGSSLARAIKEKEVSKTIYGIDTCLLYTSPSPRDGLLSRMPS